VSRAYGMGSGQLGSPDTNETGEDRGSQRDPHFDSHANVTRGRFLPSCSTAMTISDTPVASSVLVSADLDSDSHCGSEAAKIGSAGAL